MLSLYGQVLPESETPATEPEREELQDLLRRRRQLVEQRVQEVNRLDNGCLCRRSRVHQAPYHLAGD